MPCWFESHCWFLSFLHLILDVLIVLFLSLPGVTGSRLLCSVTIRRWVASQDNQRLGEYASRTEAGTSIHQGREGTFCPFLLPTYKTFFLMQKANIRIGYRESYGSSPVHIFLLVFLPSTSMKDIFSLRIFYPLSLMW